MAVEVDLTRYQRDTQAMVTGIPQMSQRITDLETALKKSQETLGRSEAARKELETKCAQLTKDLSTAKSATIGAQNEAASFKQLADSREKHPDVIADKKKKLEGQIAGMQQQLKKLDEKAG